MEYVKTQSTTAIEFPYTYENLLKENPYTSYDSRYTLPEWYVQTDDAIKNNYSLQPVIFNEDIPKFDPKTQTIKQMTLPTYVDGSWILGWEVVEKTPEEIQIYQDNLSKDSIL